MSLDLDEIRERALLTRDGFYHVVGAHRVMRGADFNALVAEVERLRAQVADYRLMIDGLENAAHEERAAVVAYFRKQANAPHPIERGVPSLSPAGRGLLLLHADRIERGEHRREETK